METQTLKTIANLRGRIAKAEEAEIRAVQDLRTAREALAARGRKEISESPASARLKVRIRDLEASRGVLEAKWRALQNRLADLLDKLAVTSPQELAGKVETDVPIALFPVKLETRFFRTGRSLELRVRIFPDQVAISALQEAMTEAEEEAGKVFWREMAAAAADPDSRATVEQAAADTLAKRTEGHRTLWIALQLRPDNWPEKPGQPLPKPEALAFPSSTPRPTNTAATARILPDQFVVELYRGTKMIHSATTRSIRDTLVIGPDAEGALARIERDAKSGEIKTTENLRWLFDYAAAVAAGMAVTIPITAADRKQGFDRVLALGLRISEGGTGGAELLREHLRALRFSTGVDVLPNGTPTNNPEEVGAGLTSGEPDGAADVLRLARNIQPETTRAHRNKTDCQRLAEAIGLPGDAFALWTGAERRDIAEALSMNRALWPATLGGYMRDFLQPLRGGTATALQDRRLGGDITWFATDWVTGRGLLPSIRVGRQPYGVLVTSDYRSYSSDDRPLGLRSPRMPAELKILMDRFTVLFRSFEPDLKAVGRGGEPEDILTNILGLHASSVTWKSRKAVADAVSWNNMQALGFDTELAEAWFQFIEVGRRFTLDSIDVRGDREIAELLFLNDTDDLPGAVVDGDPGIPLSEAAPIRPFDGVRNYINWLLDSTADIVRTQRFEDAEGNRVPRPVALLYKYLRHALMAELAEQSAGLVAAIAPDKIARVDTQTSLIGVDSRFEALSVPDEAATVLRPKEIGLKTKASNVGEFLVAEAMKALDLIQGPAREFTLSLKDHRDALADLADLPTARLERLFAEHMDTVSYRLDAWHTGMFASRLDSMRASRKTSSGVMLGSYGYLEDLRARPEPTVLRPTQVPEGLTPEGVTQVVSRPDNGGFVHAPSQAHAVTAAVLRNGYLTHADRDDDSRFAINLDSNRAKAAMYLVEGMRNNQSMSALLGYRIERGLHENHPGLELDEHIYTLRARFPLTSRRLIDVDTSASAEVIEARNVIDGYDLIEQTRDRSYPWGISGLPAGSTAEAQAIRTEVDALEDLFDAYGDLMMAESVHQAVNGSVARARGVLQSISEGDVPPMPEVVETPRSGTVLSQTVIVEFPAAAHWPTRTERALVNARMNGWLVARLPAPETISVGFVLDGGAAQHLTLAEAGIDAIDVVLMAGEAQGGGTTMLERWLADRWRGNAANGVPDDAVLVHRGGPAAAGDAPVLAMDTGSAQGDGHALDDVLPLLLALQRIVTKARSAHALDFRLANESGDAAPNNPKGIRLTGDTPAASGPVEAALGRFAAHIGTIRGVAEDPALLAAYEAVSADVAAFDAATWTGPVSDLRAAMRAAWLHGFGQAAPRHALGVTASVVRDMFEQSVELVQALTPHHDRAVAALEPIPDDTGGAGGSTAAQLLGRRMTALDEAAAALFTKSFRLSHDYVLEADQRAELQPALDSPIETDPLIIEGWLQGLDRVRPPLAHLSLVRDWGDWLRHGADALTPVQLPRIAGDPWIGHGWTAGHEMTERLAIMLVGGDGRAAGAKAGLVLDSFSETVPAETEITGLSFHYDRPNAEAPQAILLAVPPDLDKGWSWDALRGTVLDTFDRARLRAVEPDHLVGTAYFQVMPANLVSFSQGFWLSTFLGTNAVTSVTLGE
ncbi:MAG: hypothetical protein GY933_07810 [Hyphomicrobiales bacterium]|nr:hypothetical protein [Hyphomicrobiales bacterium]